MENENYGRKLEELERTVECLIRSLNRQREREQKSNGMRSRLIRFVAVAGIAITPLVAFAYSVTNSFEGGTTISSSDMNQNFTDVVNALNELDTNLKTLDDELTAMHVCPADMAPMYTGGKICIDKQINAETDFYHAYKACYTQGLRLCSATEVWYCDWEYGSDTNADLDCDTTLDSNTYKVWVTDASEVAGQAFAYSHSAGNNIESLDTATNLYYYCCADRI